MRREYRTRWFYFWVAWTPLLLLAAAITWLLFQAQDSASRSVLLSEQRKAVQLASTSLSSTLASVRSDLLFLAAQAELQGWPENETPSSQQPLANTFLAFVENKQRYDQLRLIGVDGQEKIRVNWNDGHPVIVDQAQLQNKLSRYYVKNGLALSRGQVYVSPFDLNIEHDKIEQPIKPMIRFVTPVTDERGQVKGVIVLNFMGKEIIHNLDRISLNEPGKVWLLNADGYWLYGGAPGDDWAFMYDNGQSKTLAARFPQVWREIASGRGIGQYVDHQNIYTAAKIFPINHIGNNVPASANSQGKRLAHWYVVSMLPSSYVATGEYRLRHKFLVSFSGLAFVLAIASAMFSRAVVRRHLAEEKLRASESTFRSLLEAAPDAIVIIDKSGHIVLANARAKQAFGYDKDELLGKPIEVLVPEEIAHHHVSHRNEYLSMPRTRPMGVGLDLHARRKDGSLFPVEISLSPVPMGEDVLVFSAIRDVTEQRLIDRQIKHLNESLALQNGELMVVNRELEAFSYSVSHDLRTPLRAIDGFSTILVSELGDSLSPQHKDYLMRVRRGAQRMGELIDDLLNLSRITRAEIHNENVDLTALAESVSAGIAEQHPERAVTFEIEPGMQAFSDGRLLRVALENLLGNAFKFSSKTDEPIVSVGTEIKDGERVYFVKDNGAGFDMAYADKLFGAFQRLHSSSDFPGTGIGLATVQRIIHKLGGRIWAVAEVGQGATFYFTLREAEVNS